MNQELISRIEINPNIMLGKPVIRNTRITVELILTKLASKISLQDLLKDYPQLTQADVQAALVYAANIIGTEELQLIT